MSVRKPQYDDRGILDKLSAGDITALDGGDLATVADAGLGVAGLGEKILPVVGDIVPYSTPISAALGGVKGYYEYGDEAARRARYFDKKTIDRLVRNNPQLKGKFNEEGFSWSDSLGRAGALFAGGTAGASVLTTLSYVLLPFALPVAIPAALIGGTLLGGTIANKMYNAAFEKQEQDPVIIAMQMADIHSKGGYVTPELAGAALLANLPKKLSRGVDDRLEEYTDTKLFTEALSDHNNNPKLRAMTVAFDDKIRLHTDMPRDPQNQFKTVAEQYADMINSGQMKPQDIINPRAGVSAMIAMARSQAPEVDVPVTPEEARQNYVSRT